MGNSLLVTGALMGMDVRIAAPVRCWPADERRRPRASWPRGPARGSRSPTTRAACEGVDFVHTDVWVSMGEPKEMWAERIDAADAVPGQRRR